MQRSIDTMAELLDALLDISKLDSGAVVPDFVDTRIDARLQRIVNDNVQQAEAKGLRLECVGATKVVHTDPALLTRVIENFVTNAVRYSEHGTVQIQCAATNDGLRISVSDTGIGIPEDELDRVFDEYYQLDNSVRSRHKGLGLGLSISKHIAQLLGLRIEVTSSVGVGSVFSVVVPYGPDDQEGGADPLQPKAPAKTGQLVVLVVDDDTVIVDATSMLLRSDGMQVHTAVDGAQALNKLQDGLRPDLLLTDYRLPGLSGVELVRSIREHLQATLPAIIVTGDTSCDELKALDLARCTVLHKPIDTGLLITLIREMSHS